MTVIVTPSESSIFVSLKQFLTDNLPAGVEVKKGQQNRASMPKGNEFVIMTPLRRTRLETNIDTYTDCFFKGSITANVLTVDSIFYGSFGPSSVIFPVGVTVSSIVVIAQLTPTTFSVTPTPDFADGFLAAGTQSQLQPVKWDVQLDVYGPNSGDNSHRISTLFRDEYAATAFAGYPTGLDVQPLYADDPKQVPLVDAEAQWNNRWMLEACLQANQAVVNIPQQFFDKIVLGLINVDTFYPA